MAESIPRILVCDDETFFREAIRDVLHGEHLEVIEAADGEAALELASDPSIGVMILDIRLPGIDGLEVLRRLAVERADLQVIMLSANQDQELVLDALRLGACDYLAKPLHDEELVLAVRRAVGAHSVAQDWGRLRSRVDRLAGHLDALSRVAEEAVPEDEAWDDALHEALVAAANDVVESTRSELWSAPPESDPSDASEESLVSPRLIARHGLADPLLGAEAARWALDRAESFVVADVSGDERLSELSPEDRPGSASFAVCIVRSRARTAAVLCVADRAGGGRFTSDDLSLLRMLCAHAAALSERRPPSASSEPIAQPEEPVDGDAELARTICDAITNEVAPEALFLAALRPIEKHLDAAPVSLYRIDPERGGLVCEASCDGGLREDRSSLPSGLGLTGAVLQTGRMVASDHPELDARFDPEVDTPLDGEVGPLLCVPLSLRGKVVGVFRAFPRDGAEGSARSAEVIGAALSAAVRNALLYRSLLESIDEVAEARRAARS